MTIKDIEKDFKKKVCDGIRILSEGNNRFRIFTPFHFSDGDKLSAVLKKNGSGWLISDEGNTMMRLTYKIPESRIESGIRGKVIESALNSFSLSNSEGVLTTQVIENNYGNALFSFIQGVLRITDTTYWNRYFTRSAFLSDFSLSVESSVPEPARRYQWYDEATDPKGQYPVDYRIGFNGQPLFLFGVQNDDKCQLTTIVLLHYQKLGVPFTSAAVYEDMEKINRKAVARLSDVVGKQFSNLENNRDQLRRHLRGFLGLDNSHQLAT